MRIAIAEGRLVTGTAAQRQRRTLRAGAAAVLPHALTECGEALLVRIGARVRLRVRLRG